METRRAGVQQLLVMKEEEDATEQQECSSSLDQEGQEPPLIKEEPEEEDLDQIKEEATQFSLTPVQVKSEVDGATSSWTQHMKTEADGDTCGGAEAASDLDTPLLPDHQRSPCSDSVDSEDRRETIDPESASNSMEDQNVHLKMPHGSTNKHCNNCNAVIAVACKTCKICQAEQPRRQRLAKRLKTFEKKKEEWLKNQKKNNTASRVMDEAQMLLEKLHALGHRAVVFLARPGKKAGTWSSQVVHSKWHLTGQASKCLDRMKDLYEVVVTGLPPRKSRKTEDGSKECSHMVGDDGYYPVKRVVKTKHQKGKVMKLIEWEPCSMCGKSFPLQWVPKAATKR
ncbi:uncharacterized protein LOC128752551 isoform X2 [Synchiropus splendidus]|uniref:uncharacterized protein LOC128752551 isoform X2 n=1 Tax=Synchiropus splendidus TaxID=270530 RepID=UPI00237D671B|nr:uncharacterized protein LOC128752551 isoform X2 [Synchiropus splendidus]